MSAGPNASLGVASSSLEPPTSTVSDREQIKIDFYHTYDAMTGIRIAATLGGFFGLMVILVVYKSKSKTEKALADPTLAAAAVADVEEEEQRQIQAAIEATVFQTMNPRSGRRSLDISNSPAGWVRSTTRFSSVGGYSSLMEPPIRTHSRLPCFIDEDSPPEDEFEDLSTYNRYLDVPRRSSNITCSSSDSSYLERRGSSVILGLPAVPAHKSCSGRRRQSSPLPEQYDFYYPIDIRVIQPTPGGSPCGSERALYNIPVTNVPMRRAPLASISSCNSSLGADYPDLEMQSLTSDTVFQEDDCPDTEDEVDPFSTDSETSESNEHAWCRRDSKGSLKRHRRTSIKNRRVSIPCISENIPVINENRENDFSELRPSTSDYNPSVDEYRLNISEFRMSVSEHDLNCSEATPFIREKSLSVSEDSSHFRGGAKDNILNVPMRSRISSEQSPCTLPTDKSADSLTLIESGNGSTVTLPTLPLVERTPSSSTLKKEGSWSQETLF